MGNNVNDQGKVKVKEALLMTVVTNCKICVHLPILIEPVGYGENIETHKNAFQ